MAATQREFSVEPAIADVWDFVSDMGNWASQMPGYVSHETISVDDSAWTLNVDLGPFSRTIVVDVHVSEWRKPHEVIFEVKGRYEPFSGGGRYKAESAGSGTRIALDFHAEPGGSMAKIISPLVGPVLESIASEFSKNLAQALGGACATQTDVPKRQDGFFKRLWMRVQAWLRAGR